jgi:hypothetical protein
VRYKDNPMSCPLPRTVISHRFVLVGGVAVFYKERFYYKVELVGNCRKVINKTLDIRFKDLC